MWKPEKALNLSVSNRTTIPAEIADCKGLKVLDLSHTKVSDLKPLEKLTSLETLHLSYTQVSDNAETVKKLCAQGCRIFRWKSTA